MTYPYKLDRSAFGFNVLCFAALAGWGLVLVVSSDITSRPAAAPMLVFALGFAPIFYPQRVEIRDGILRVKSGILVLRKIELAQVYRVYHSTGWPLSHTWTKQSGWRLAIGTQTVFLMPADESAVFDALRQACPHLNQYGDELRCAKEDVQLPAGGRRK